MYYYKIQFYNQIVEVILVAIGILAVTRPKKNKFLFFILSPAINFGVCYLLNQYELSDLIPILLVFINCLLLKLLKKDFCIKDVISVIFAYTVYLICVYISIQAFTWALDLRPLSIIARCSIYTIVNLAVLSKILYLIFIVIGLLVKLKSLLNLINNEWNKVCLIIVSMMLVLAFCGIKYMYSYTYIPITPQGYVEIFITFISCAIGVMLFFKFYKVYYEELIERQKEQEKQKTIRLYMSNNLANLKRIKMDIDNKEHRINYILQSLEYDLINKSYDDALKKLNIAKELVAKIEPVIYTENEMFDFMINMEIKQLYLEHKKIKVGTFISKRDIYDEYRIWNTIVELIRKVSEYSRYFELFVIEKNEYTLEVKFIVNEVEGIDLLKRSILKINNTIKDKQIDNIYTFTYNEKLTDI